MMNNSLSQDLKETQTAPQLTKGRLVPTGPLGGSRHHPVSPEKGEIATVGRRAATAAPCAYYVKQMHSVKGQSEVRGK